MSSLKMIQSELGVTGDASPNVELMESIGKQLSLFDHTHDTITGEDCYLLVGHIRVGNLVADKKPALGFILAQHGCFSDLKLALTKWLREMPEILPVVQLAIMDALLHPEEDEG